MALSSYRTPKLGGKDRSSKIIPQGKGTRKGGLVSGAEQEVAFDDELGGQVGGCLVLFLMLFLT
jgi:hypothetical protein